MPAMIWTSAFDEPPDLDAEALVALLGGKGANLAVMANELGLPVPPGFVISTEACKAFPRAGWPAGLDEELRSQLARIEGQVGRRFGDASDPLLLSVRSGAPVSMPGMLDTILNLGLNEATTAGLARVSGDVGFATSCRQRLETMYRDIVGVRETPDDPWQQLRAAIEAVFRSWDSERARRYREKEAIPPDLGTAVVVQAMVFGNRGRDSATGVLFTRDPATGEHVLYGDVLFGAQGEDVVAGTHATEPIVVLDTRMPAVAARLRSYAERLEQHFRDLCDIEFTIEQGRLWMLQTRIGKRTARAACRAALEMAEDPGFPLTRAEAVERVRDLLAHPPSVVTNASAGVPVVARGLGASPGLVSGAIATSPEAAVRMADAGTAVLLVRAETSPHDVHGMARSIGILTSSGGLASHAAVVARGWDIPAVVGASAVVVADGSVTIGATTWLEGETFSIDGSSGEIYSGAVATLTTIVPEAITLLAWAKELGIAVTMRREEGWMGASPALEPGPGTASEDVVRALSIKGYVTPGLLAPALGISPESAQGLLERLVVDGIASQSGGMYSLAAGGKALAVELLATDREDWGPAAAQAALDGFLVLDGRMKTIVTAWQMKEVDGGQVLNDHADAAYDAAVLADLAALHGDASAWIDPLVDGLPRLMRYARRLDAAAAAAAAGDGQHIASPRVDSYHGIWFELHEDLIRLAGRTREEEVAAGRA
ncbi:MAG TPA: pyruvate, phosphate dikinase [Candidatus Limnocylindrales bacterium]|nr:pyruvate, phosphate dikinase [Candidatus Limnocylindrales bacterium]